MQSAYDKAVDSIAQPPLKVVVLRDSHWASTFEDTPPNPIRVGLRLLSLKDKDIVRAVAIRAATEAIEGTADAESSYKTAMIVTSVARAMCHPLDARKGNEFFSAPDDMIPLALREETISWLFDEIEKLSVEHSPIFSEATDDEIVELRDTLATGTLKKLDESDPVRAKRVRRYLDFVIEELADDSQENRDG